MSIGGGTGYNLEKELLESNFKKIKRISLWSIPVTTSAFFACYFGSYFSDQKLFNVVNYCTKRIVNYITDLF